jgi:hypothetical protein
MLTYFALETVMDIKTLIGGDKKVRFKRCENGTLVYEAEGGFEFPVPSEDLKGATFLAEDKASLFMRWIRKEIARLKEIDDLKARGDNSYGQHGIVDERVDPKLGVVIKKEEPLNIKVIKDV